MENIEPAYDLTRLVALKRYEQPPPGFSHYLRGRIMREIAAERERLERPWWTRWFEEVTWQRGMVAANALAFAGVAFLAAATYQVAHSVANEEVEGQVYAALPLPPEVVDRAEAEATIADEVPGYLRPLPSSGVTGPVQLAFSLSEEPSIATKPPPSWIFDTPSAANPRFILASDRDRDHR